MRLHVLRIIISKASGDDEHIRGLPSIHVRLLLYHACFDLTPSPVGTARGNHAAQYQKDVPEQKGNEFVRVVAFPSTATTITTTIVVVLVSVAASGTSIGSVVPTHVRAVKGIVRLEEAQTQCRSTHAIERHGCYCCGCGCGYCCARSCGYCCARSCARRERSSVRSCQWEYSSASCFLDYIRS
jgi:hypothetical protein